MIGLGSREENPVSVREPACMAVNDSVSVQRLRLSCSGGKKEEVGLIVAAAGESPLPIRRQSQGLAVAQPDRWRTICLSKVNGVAGSARLSFLAEQKRFAVGRECHRIGPVQPCEVTFRHIVGGTDNQPPPPVVPGEEDSAIGQHILQGQVGGHPGHQPPFP